MSEVFIDAINYELAERFMLGKQTIVPLAASNEDKAIYTGKARKFASVQLAAIQGRNKSQNQKGGIQQAICEEIIQWALNSKTEMINSASISAPNERSLQLQLY